MAKATTGTSTLLSLVEYDPVSSIVSNRLRFPHPRTKVCPFCGIGILMLGFHPRQTGNTFLPSSRIVFARRGSRMRAMSCPAEIE